MPPREYDRCFICQAWTPERELWEVTFNTFFVRQTVKVCKHCATVWQRETRDKTGGMRVTGGSQ